MAMQLPLDSDGVPLDEFPHLEKWMFKLLKRPGFEKGRHVPQRHTAFD
jgi:glutathione S-transferase